MPRKAPALPAALARVLAALRRRASRPDPHGRSTGFIASDGAWRVGFFSADWTPWSAIAMCRARWPALGCLLRVVYAAKSRPARPPGASAWTRPSPRPGPRKR